MPAALTREQFNALLETQGSPCVTLMMPTVKAGPEVQQNAIRFKNLIRQVQDQLQKCDTAPRDLRMTIRTLERLSHDDDFWQHQAASLALFVEGDNARFFRVPIPLPEMVVVGERFKVAPLLPLLQNDGVFYILAVSRNATRLLMGTRDEVHEVHSDGMPQSLAELTGVKYEQQSFFLHSFRVRQRGGGTAVPHGYWQYDDEADLREYFKRIDEAVRDAIGEPETPLVFAGIESNFALYKDINQHPGLCGDFIQGNVEHLADHALHQRAWAIVEPEFHRAAHEAATRFLDARGTDLTRDDATAILDAARQGAVGTLLVSEDQLQGDAENLVVETLRRGGEVHVIDPQAIEGRKIAAILRYALPEALVAAT